VGLERGKWRKGRRERRRRAKGRCEGTSTTEFVKKDGRKGSARGEKGVIGRKGASTRVEGGEIRGRGERREEGGGFEGGSEAGEYGEEEAEKSRAGWGWGRRGIGTRELRQEGFKEREGGKIGEERIERKEEWGGLEIKTAKVGREKGGKRRGRRGDGVKEARGEAWATIKGVMRRGGVRWMESGG